MWEYLAVLLLGFWLGVAIFLYVSCYWLDEILDLPSRERSAADPSGARSGASIGASGAHAQLKRLVARVVEEAASLPALARYAAEPATPVENSTYEDLLATAILNKVIERYQAESGSGGRSSGIHSASASPTPSERSSPRSPQTQLLRDLHRDNTPPLRDDDEVLEWNENEVIEEIIELPRRVPFPEFGGDIVHTSENDDRDFDEVSGSDLQASDGTWEENWLFQKKKIKSVQSVPVPMLVPNSNIEYRVLIGDKDIDDTSDLSDNASDAEGEAEYKSDIKRVLDSKHVIGGKTKLDDLLNIEPDSLTVMNEVDTAKKENSDNTLEKKIDNIVNDKETEINDHILETINNSVLTVDIDSGPLVKPEFIVDEIHRTASHNENTDDFFDGLNHNGQDDQSLVNNKHNKDTISTYNGHEEERGYEETVDVPVQRYADSLRRKYYDDDEPITLTIANHFDENKDDDLIPGSIAYRERKKWLNYVEMPNNPYSPEAIQKRLSAKSTSSIFDTLTSSRNDISEINNVTNNLDNTKGTHDLVVKQGLEEVKLKEEYNHEENGLNNNIIQNNNERTSARIKSSSPKILKDVLADEVPQYKRYGRDYYIKEARKSTGGRKKSYSDTSSISSLNKSTSLDNFDSEFTSPVSASSSLSDLEASALHQNIVRAVLSPRNASPNFAINPIYENNEKPFSDSSPSGPIHNSNTNHGLLIQQFNAIAMGQKFTDFSKNSNQPESVTTTCHLNNKKNDISIEYDDAPEQSLFSAKAVYIAGETDDTFDEILQSVNSDIHEVNHGYDKNIDDTHLKSPTNQSVADSFVSSSSLEDSIKIYNVQTGEIVTCKPRDNVSQDRCDVKADSNDNINMLDKNYEEKIEGHNLSQCNGANTDDNTVDFKLKKKMSIEELELPKVKDLARIFVSTEPPEHQITINAPVRRRRGSQDNVLNGDIKSDKTNKQAYMHSLTARSISKEFRDELRMSLATPLKVPGGTNELPEGIEEVIKQESSRPGSPLPEPGTLKTKLAFFESLKSKFSSK